MSLSQTVWRATLGRESAVYHARGDRAYNFAGVYFRVLYSAVDVATICAAEPVLVAEGGGAVGNI